MTGTIDRVSEATAAIASTDERLAYRGVFQRLLIRPEVGAVIGAGVIWAFFWAVAEPFGNAGGISQVLDVAATLGIMAVAVSMLMIGGEFDLSAGAATGTMGILVILMVRDASELGGIGLSLWIALPATLVAALMLGWINGTLVDVTSQPSFIVTLASFFVLKGAKLGFAKLITGNISVGSTPDAAGRGYEFWRPIFAAEWNRNDWPLAGRDPVYVIAVLAGFALLLAALYELSFLRKERPNPIGIVAMVAGAAAAVAATVGLHRTDGYAINAVLGAVIAVSFLVSAVGLGVWRYERVLPQKVANTDGGRWPRTMLFGLGAVALGVVFSSTLDSAQSATTRDTLGTDDAPVALYAGLAFMTLTFGFLMYRMVRTRGGIVFQVIATTVAALFGLFGLIFLSTEQGIRSVLFVGLGALGLIAIVAAAGQANSDSRQRRVALLFLAAAVLTGLAFIVQAQSEAFKFRAEAFSLMLALAAIIAVWAVTLLLFQERRHSDPDADKIGKWLALAALALMTVGFGIRLLFTTEAELERGVTPAFFSVRVLWFIGFTAACAWVLARTKFGSWTFAVGGNKEAARQVGVPAARTKTQLFMLVAFAAWLVGMLLAFRLNSIQAGVGDGQEFEYIIAAVVGGTLLTGGYGSAIGAAIGALIMAMSKLGIPSARWESDWRWVFLGVILLSAVIGNRYIREQAEAAR